MSKIVEQARAMAKQVRFEDSEHIPNTNVFKESADLIDTLAAELERERKLATGYDSLIHELEEERDALREKLEALSQPVSMEPVKETHCPHGMLVEKYCYNCESEVAAQFEDKPVSMEPVAWGIVASNTGRICQVELDADEVAEHNPKYIVPLYTATQLAAARQQGADEQKQKSSDAYESFNKRIAELEAASDFDHAEYKRLRGELEQKNAQLLEFAQEWIAQQGTDENYMVSKARAAIEAAEVKP